MNKYRSGDPPSLNLQNIPTNIPIAFLNGKQDHLANKQDVDRLAGELGSRVKMYKEYDNFDHFGFSVGKDMSWTGDVVELIQTYTQSDQQ